MRLLIFSQHFWPEKFRINTIVENLNNDGDFRNILVYTCKPNYPDGVIDKKYDNFKFQQEQYLNSKTRIYRVPIIPRGKATSVRLILNYLSYIFFGIINLPKIKERNDICFVYCTSPIFQCIPAIIYAKIKRIPIVIWLQDLWPESAQETGHINNKVLLKIIGWISKKIYNNVNLILCQSEDFLDHLKKSNVKSSIDVLYNPADKNTSELTFNKTKNLKNKIVFTGNLGKAQNLDNICEALMRMDKKIFDKIEFHFYGNGSEKEKFRKKIFSSHLKEYIFFHDPIYGEEYNSMMLNADAFLLPLKSGVALSKTIPAKFQTYISYCKPIICMSDGIVTNYINNNNLGFACKSEEIDNFNKIIQKFINSDYKYLKQQQINCKHLLEKKFLIRNITDKLKKILQNEILKSKR